MAEVPAVGRDPDRLNGWKEIATFLGKGVRTAQRWERKVGLPVHRLGHEGGEIVFALKSEIARWSLAPPAFPRDAAGTANGSVDPGARNRAGSGPEAPNVENGDRTGTWRSGLRLLTGATLLVLAGVGAWTIATWVHRDRRGSDAPT